MERSIKSPFLFEIAWEVANKVGGIYTVIRTKASVTVEEFGGNFCLIGPMGKNAALEVEPLSKEAIEEKMTSHPNLSFISQALESMRGQGINCLLGHWLIDGNPTVVLFDLASAYGRLDGWKGDLWHQTGIPAPNDPEMNDAIVFGYLTSWFLGEFARLQEKDAIIAHFHEWLSGVGLVLCKKRSLPIATIFTTHATLLGRYLCSGDVDFYNNLQFIDVDYEAGKRGIYNRYCLERASCHSADVFTTVSHITAYEAEHLLKRRADGVLPNGLNVVKFSAMHEFQNLHAANKEKIHAFVEGHFYGHMNFNLDDTLYFFIAGRYEYRNKGVDMFIEALGRLNDRLKYYNSPMTVVAFIIMPASNRSYTVDTLKGQAVTKQLQGAVSEIQNRIGKRIYQEALRGKMCSNLMKEEDLVLLKRNIYSLKKDSLPSIVTHNMNDDANDPILNHIRKLGLFNNLSDRVKVVFHPEFLSSNNPVLPLDYEDFVRGCHLGVFPSYYEPWGYTPAECTVMGIPSITTNLSGFGCFIEDSVESPADYGLYIVDRRRQSVDDSINQLTQHLFEFCRLTRRQRINLRNRTERLSDILDWKRMGMEYKKARLLAIMRKYPEQFDELDSKTEGFEGEGKIMERPGSAPPSPRFAGRNYEEEFD